VVWEYNAQARLDGLRAGCLAGGRSVNESNTTKMVAPEESVQSPIVLEGVALNAA
jgi:hypothetical protein